MYLLIVIFCLDVTCKLLQQKKNLLTNMVVLFFRAVSLMEDGMSPSSKYSRCWAFLLPHSTNLSFTISVILTLASNILWWSNRPLISFVKVVIYELILASVLSNCWISFDLLSLFSVAAMCALAISTTISYNYTMLIKWGNNNTSV